MGSKRPTDLFPSPHGESQSSSLGSEGRQLRSRLVEFCNLCQKPMPTTVAGGTSGKVTASHVHCTCVTPPNTTVSTFSVAMSPKKKKIESEITGCGGGDGVVGAGEPSKRQLFKDVVKMELVDVDRTKHAESLPPPPPPSPPPPPPPPPPLSPPPLSSSSLSSAVSRAAAYIKSEDENVAKKNEIKSRHPCTMCSKCFNTPGKLNQHMFSHTGEKPFVCSHCSKAFSSKFKLVRHILIHSDLRQYRCTVCDRTFHRKDHLKNHSKVHSPVKRRFKCDRVDCGKEYSSILSYRKHIAVHSAEEGNLECKICGKRFESKEETLFHLKVHAGSRSLKTPADRKYRCDHCERSFFTGKDVRRHLVVHTGRRDFLCQYCPQRFGRKDHLTRHIKKSHSASSKKTKSKRQPAVAAAVAATVTGAAAAIIEPPSKGSKSIDNILIEMFEEKSCCVPIVVGDVEANVCAATATKGDGDGNDNNDDDDNNDNDDDDDDDDEDDLYRMHGLESPVDVLKLESSSDIILMGSLDDKTPLQAVTTQQPQPPPPSKVDDSMSLYQMPILDTNIPFNKYEQYPFENYPYNEDDGGGVAGEPIAGPSSSSSPSPAILPELLYHQQPQHHHHHQQQQQQQQQHLHHHHHHHQHHLHSQQQPQPPPPPYPTELTFSPETDDGIKVETEYGGVTAATAAASVVDTQQSTLDLVLPPIPNISPNVLLMNPDFQNYLTSTAAAAVAATSVSSSSSSTTATATATLNVPSAATLAGNIAADGGGDGADNGAAAESIFNFLPTPNELLASLLSTADPQTNSAPLPGFSQAFHQPP